jgi:hypothetical protein
MIQGGDSPFNDIEAGAPGGHVRHRTDGIAASASNGGAGQLRPIERENS